MVPEWPTLAAVALIVGIPLYAWFRNMLMVQALALTCFAVFILGALTAGRIDGTIGGSPILADLAFKPGYLEPRAWAHLYTLVTAMFLHADVVHVVANMVIFVLMGLGLEDRVGRVWFLFIFLFSGFGGSLVHSLLDWNDPVARIIPMVGASGAVFGVIAAYATAYPRDQVPLFAGIIIPRVPVWIAAMVYTVLELILILANAFGNVARYAHVGGLVFGVIGAFILGREKGVARRRRTRADVSLAALGKLAATEEQRNIHAKMVANRDEPELYKAWLERFALATSCARCGRRFEAAGSELRCSCGNRIRIA